MRNNKNNMSFNIRSITLNYKISIFSLQNIISSFRNLNAHLTDKQKIVTSSNKILTLRFKNITLSLLILILSLVNITLCFSNYNNTSALDYSSNVGIGFTFNPTLSINISSSDLIIDNLTPGTNSDSNIINVSVATNAAYGYTLSATVGDSLHNNTNLTHTNNINVFSNIATDSSLPSLTTDNTWGYSYKLSNNTTWNNYSGLSTEIGKTLVNTDNQLAKPIDFKIAAKASSTQPSGTYTNTINFIAVSKPIPKTIEDIVYMQTFGELLPTDLQSVKDSMEEEHAYILKDARDEQDYTIAKLKDGKIWMTKNLNLAGGTEITSELSDVSTNYTLPTANGFQEGNRLPESSQTGFSNDAQAYVYNTGNNTDNCASPGCYSYYSWDTVTAGSGVDIATSDTDAPYSICPKGWKLPNTRTGTNSSADFRALAIAYGGLENIERFTDTTSPTGATIYTAIRANPAPSFLPAGNYDDSDHLYGENIFGYYWTTTSSGSSSASILSFYSSVVNFASMNFRRRGLSARCLAR